MKLRYSSGRCFCVLELFRVGRLFNWRMRRSDVVQLGFLVQIQGRTRRDTDVTKDTFSDIQSVAQIQLIDSFVLVYDGEQGLMATTA